MCATNYERFEIILADNASTDGSAAWVRSHFPQVRVETFDRNYGYCGGNNRAAAKARFDTLLFLNNDVEVEPGWLSPLNQLLEERPSVAVIQPKIRSYRQKTHFEYAGAAGGFLDKYGYPFCRGRIFDTIEEDLGQYDTPSPIFWASGAALVIRAPIFVQLGGFEEKFEFHMEEIDLCWQVHRAGKQVWYCPQSVVYHLGAGSLPVNSPRKVHFNFRNNLWMIRRNLRGWNRFKVLWVRGILDELASLQFLFTGKFALAFTVAWATVSGNLAPLPQTKPIHPNPPDSAAPPLYPKSIVLLYFLRRIKLFQHLPGADFHQRVDLPVNRTRLP